MPQKTRKCSYSGCKEAIYTDNKSGLCRVHLDAKNKAATPVAQIAADREKQRVAFEVATLRKKYDEALRQIKVQDRELAFVRDIAETEITPYVIEPKHSSGTSEGVVVAVASDWHIEERVDPAKVNGLNKFNTDIAQERAESFFRSTVRLTRLLAQDIKVETLVLALLGDFITNELREDSAELNALEPMHALLFAENLIVSGINYILEHAPGVRLVVPCHSGNHARTTHKTRFGAENGHSLEFLMYVHLSQYFAARGETRVEFRISEGYHSFLDLYGVKLRLHHGHAINYQGGIGGIFIPAFKSISQWDKANRADLDVFGHFHQSKDGGKFICNGSLIGYNSYALSIKADYEQPKQTLFLVDKKRGRTCTWPILFNR